jgi:hypothetical protein
LSQLNFHFIEPVGYKDFVYAQWMPRVVANPFSTYLSDITKGKAIGINQPALKIVKRQIQPVVRTILAHKASTQRVVEMLNEVL